jgi:hypothetical protein
VTATRLAEVGARDAQPLELGRGGEHPLQQPPVVLLDRGALAQGAPRLANAGSESIAHPLQLAEADQARLARRGRHSRVDLDTGKRLRGKPAELGLEAADLAPQLGASEALVALDSNPSEVVPVEQLHHDPFRV